MRKRERIFKDKKLGEMECDQNNPESFVAEKGPGLVVVKTVFEGNSGVQSVAPTELCALGRGCVLVICRSDGN